MADESLNRAPVTTAKAALGGHGHDNRGLEAGSIPGMAYGRFEPIIAKRGATFDVADLLIFTNG